MTILTIVGIIFRSEIALLLATHTIYLLLQRGGLHPIRDVIPSGFLGLLIGLALTIPIDSYFWQRPLWPELQGFIFNFLHGQSSAWGTSSWHFYFTSALPRLLFNPITYVLCIPLTLAIPVLRGPALCILVPNIAFIAIYSLQPHKEWRFIIYVIPPLLAVAAAGASWIWSRRAKTMVYRILSYVLIASVFASFLASFAMLAISRLNYPGAFALDRLHSLAADSPGVVRVHMDTQTCTTGITRFLQSNSPQIQYSKSERPEDLLSPDFWSQFTHALTESPESVLGDNWTTVATVKSFAGIRILRPGEGMDEMDGWIQNLSARDLARSWWKYIQAVEFWEAARQTWDYISALGKWGTGGWWIGVRMEEKVWVLRRE